MIAFPLERFVEAQADSYATALAEIRRGAKRSHWMWFIFPQLTGLGRSATARFYGISSLDEARAYLKHAVLGARYLECVGALQDLRTSDPIKVFGETDAIKLRSSLTLFQAAQPMLLFGAAIDRWFAGVEDAETLRLLSGQLSEGSASSR
ncbi:DUF1810 domain-containing protein [Sphingomonas sp. MG17]|uniref:DUF1810 domain-containing protein n=1 Tax=Sphingomonas tagetis TaxID=2949092 RepID=A0A9X2HKU9_9SPHN|nr:DUF1810 domain-containing protein [Sphingomonas tagetis]MCP3731527.1 DUF1810 domain-containing protein [Sphingomonas tagetis]